MTIGQRIKIRREELGLSQEDLAHRIGYKSKSSINKIELDVQQLRQSKIKQIADALDTTTDYIMGWSDEDSESKVDPLQLITEQYGPNVYEFLQLFIQLDRDDQIRVLERMHILLEDKKYATKKELKNA